jgi:hypothetical protein
MYPPPNYWESSETETTLPDLQQYADVQNTAIKLLYESQMDPKNPVFFTRCHLPVWNAILSEIWKQGENTFQETVEVLRGAGSERFDDTLLDDTVPAQCNVATMPGSILGDTWGRKYFIRPEYEEAQKAALWACGFSNPDPFDNIVFSGSPGIGMLTVLVPHCATIGSHPICLGKSVFLILLLLRRLALGLPTGLKMDSHYSLLFWEGGVLEFRETATIAYTTLRGTPDPLSRIWVLVDSKKDLSRPTGPSFSDPGPFFVVVAASPRDRFQLVKKTINCSFIMKPWTFSEVLQA